jgi:hypothetical protein
MSVNQTRTAIGPFSTSSLWQTYPSTSYMPAAALPKMRHKSTPGGTYRISPASKFGIGRRISPMSYSAVTKRSHRTKYIGRKCARRLCTRAISSRCTCENPRTGVSRLLLIAFCQDQPAGDNARNATKIL